MNAATIRGHNLSMAEEVEVAAAAGYDGIEPWVSNIAKHAEQGGSLKDLSKRIADLGLAVESAIGFPRWIDDDDAQRAQGLEDMKRDMDLVRQIGGRRIAAPPAGAHATPDMNLLKVAERYRVVLELGRTMGVVPQLEIWGSSKTLGRVGEAVYVAVEAGHEDACLLLDAYHIYKSGSSFTGLKMINWSAMHVFHINDYPADPPREEINDSHRVYPGDGICPLPAILRDMYDGGFRGVLSLELFNRRYWQQDARTVARTGLEKTKAVVAKAMA
ncbi:MAG: sugar phosphate isomerase/epimerase [Pirellulales bacterium]|nr:sugar phosphate isomerase/epimerase [Pirellulales bacterium]